MVTRMMSQLRQPAGATVRALAADTLGDAIAPAAVPVAESPRLRLGRVPGAPPGMGLRSRTLISPR